jgi:hypothetical protein
LYPGPHRRPLLAFGRFAWLLLLVLVSSTGSAGAQELLTDSSVVQLRALPQDRLEDFRSDKRFQYSSEQEPGSSPISSLFWQKLSEFIRNLFGSGLGKPLLWLLSIGIALFAISRLMGSSPRSVFYKRSRSITSAIEEKDLELTDFPALIEAALKRGDYREAVRLRFIKVLKELSDREWIAWTKEKTNRSYVYELRNASSTAHLADPFERITRWFDYCWYGDVIPDPALYSSIDSTFAVLERQLSRPPDAEAAT